MKSYAEMDEMSADILKELGNIGTGNAITSLAQMMGIPLDISSPSLHLAQVQEIIPCWNSRRKWKQVYW